MSCFLCATDYVVRLTSCFLVLKYYNVLLLTSHVSWVTAYALILTPFVLCRNF